MVEYLRIRLYKIIHEHNANFQMLESSDMQLIRIPSVVHIQGVIFLFKGLLWSESSPNEYYHTNYD